jgi:hypothetical protein
MQCVALRQMNKPPNPKISEAASALGKRSFAIRLERLGIDEIRRIGRETGALGGIRKKLMKKEKPGH